MRDHGEWKRLFVATAGAVALAVPLVTGVLAALRLRAQSSTGVDRPTFEAASIKPNRSGRGGAVVFGNIKPPPGPVERFVTTSTARRLIEDAYNLQDSQLAGGPSWVNSERYDINAKVPDSIVAEAVARKLTRTQQLDQVRLMLQSLLADRFKLKLSHETKELPVYTVVLAKGGLKLAPVTGTPPALPPRPVGEEEIAVFGPVSAFVGVLPQLPEVNGRMVLDQTGLKGDYLWSLHWTPENPDPSFGGPAEAGAPRPDSGGPSLFTAIQEQLGLRLESTKGPVDVLVIDHVEEPSPN
jgi:bla regulator protein BlaR1